MSKIEFINLSKGKLSKCITQKFDTISYNQCQRCLREKNIRVNGLKVKNDIELVGGENITVYGVIDNTDNLKKSIPIVFEDDNVLIINKPAGFEVIGNSDKSIEHLFNVFAVHRLDRNTEGLMILAKNIQSKNELSNAFSKQKIEKHYLSLLVGDLKKNNDIVSCFLTKDSIKGFVSVSEKQTPNSQLAVTEYKVLKRNNFFTLVDINLHTGKTHQIRATFSFLNFPVLFDDKYGNKKINNSENVKLIFKNQKGYCLTSYKLSFNFDENSFLYYLNAKQFQIVPTWEKKIYRLFDEN